MLRRDQIRRLLGAIDQNPRIPEELKAELESILQDPDEAQEFLDNKELDPYFPTRKVSVEVGSRTWALRIGPHSQIELILDNLSEEDLKHIFQSGITEAQESGYPPLEDFAKYIIEGFTLRKAPASLVVELDDLTRGLAHTVTIYRGRHRGYELGVVIRLSRPR